MRSESNAVILSFFTSKRHRNSNSDVNIEKKIPAVHHLSAVEARSEMGASKTTKHLDDIGSIWVIEQMS